MKKITIDKSCEALYICGDIHGGFERLVYIIKQYGIANAAVIVASGLRKRNTTRTYTTRSHTRLINLNNH